jgi:HlyD family secretion protein
MKKAWFVLIGLGVALLGSSVLRAREAEAPRAVLPGAPATEETSPHVAAEGRVAAYPGAEVVLGAEVTARLSRVLVDEGQQVRQGQLLVELAAEDLEAALAEAKAHGVEAAAETRLADAELKRRRELVRRNVLAVDEEDRAVRDLEVARARVATAQAQVERYAALIRKARIVAPFSGTVIRRHHHAGEMIEAGQALLTLADLRRVRVEAEADEADEGRLRTGAEVTIRSDAYPGQSWKGRVEEIADAVAARRLVPQDPRRVTDVRVMPLKVAIQEKTPLKLGAHVELRIASARP